MSDGIAMKAEFADRIDKLTELAECERQVQAAAHRYEAAEMALVSAAEDLQEWSNQWSKCRENVIRALPDMLTADALTWYGSGSRLGDANAFIRRYCDEIEARRQAHGWPAAVTEPGPTEPEPNQEASVQSEPFVSLPAETDLPASPGEVEESRDQLCSVEGCEIHADDASEFAEEGYAPVVEAEPLADPIWNEPEPTKPEADALAKAADYYSPENVAERNKFNPFGMFKREGGQ